MAWHRPSDTDCESPLVLSTPTLFFLCLPNTLLLSLFNSILSPSTIAQFVFTAGTGRRSDTLVPNPPWRPKPQPLSWTSTLFAAILILFHTLELTDILHHIAVLDIRSLVSPIELSRFRTPNSTGEATGSSKLTTYVD